MTLNDTVSGLAGLLTLQDFSPVYREADRVRREAVGDVVHIRAILEFSNHCRRQCRYCGLNSRNAACDRYRMTPEEMVDSARAAWEAGYKTIVLQSGEDPFFTSALLGEIVREIKRTGLAVTVSCGEMPREDYAHLRACGADRYLLKHETADPVLYDSLHPCGTLSERVACLKTLKALGFETGSGFMIGLPGQTNETVARDLLLLREIGCDMAGIGPFIPHRDTPFRDFPPGSVELTLYLLSLLRLIHPDLLLPATTALGTLQEDGRERGMLAGANVVMPNLSPPDAREKYTLYNGKLHSGAESAQHVADLKARMAAIGCRVVTDRGDHISQNTTTL